MMWDSFQDEAIERAMLFGRSGDNWLAVRPNRRVSDGRPATEIRCWLSKDPLRVLESCFPEISTQSSESSAVGFHTNQQVDVNLGPRASLSDVIQCWTMTFENLRKQTGIASFCDPDVARQFVSSSRWISAGSGNSEGPGEPHPDDTLAGFGLSYAILDRAIMLQSMESISHSFQVSVSNLLYLHQEYQGAPRYSNFSPSERIVSQLRLGDREGAFDEFSTDPLDPSRLSSWTQMVRGKLPFTVSEMKAISDHGEVEIWKYVRNLLGGDCDEAERAAIIELLGSSAIGEGEVQSFLETCPDYMSGSPGDNEVDSLRSLPGWGSGRNYDRLISVCALLNSNQPDGKHAHRNIMERSRNIAGMIPDEHCSESGPIGLREILSSQSLCDEISMDRRRMGPFLRKEFIDFSDRARWVRRITASELLDINRADNPGEDAIIRKLAESQEGLRGLERNWGRPSAIPSLEESESLSSEIERISMIARLVHQPKLSERISFRMPMLAGITAFLLAFVAGVVVAWTIAGATSLSMPFSLSPEAPEIPESMSPLSEIPYLVAGVPAFLVFFATSTMAFRYSSATGSRKRHILRKLGGD